MSIFQLICLAYDANNRVFDHEGDVLIFKKKVICARTVDLWKVLFEYSEKAKELDRTDKNREDEFDKWKNETDKKWVESHYGSIEELMEFIVEMSPLNNVRAIGAVVSASGYSNDIDPANCNLFLHHFSHFAIYLSIS